MPASAYSLRFFVRQTAAAVVAASAIFTSAASAQNVVVPGKTDFPESMTSTSDGTLFFSSMAGGRIFRAAPGAATSAEWVAPAGSGLNSVLGVLADEKSGVLYACSPDLSALGVAVPTGDHADTLKMFDLKTGAPKGSVPVPQPRQASLCNDIAVAPNGAVYVTDSLDSRILKLDRAAGAFKVWAQDPRWDGKGAQLDGIAVLADGTVYANIFEGDGLYRIAVKPDGAAGAVTKLRTSRPLYHSDGLRAFGPNSLLMVEGETKGTLDLVTVEGDEATIKTLKDGFEGPVSLTVVGDTVYVLDDPLKYLFDPAKKTQAPPPFTAVAVKLPSKPM